MLALPGLIPSCQSFLGRWSFTDFIILLRWKYCVFIWDYYWLGKNQHEMISLGFLAGIPVILFCCITQICNMWCYPAMGDSSLINKCKWWRWGMFCRTKSCACRGIGISRKEWLALFLPVYESVTGIFKVSKRKGEWFSGSLLSLIVICENLALSFKPSVLGDCVFYGLRRIFPFLGGWSFSP